MPLANKNMSKFPLLQSHEDSIELAADAEPSEGEKEEREEEVCCASALTVMCLGEHVTHAMCTKQTNRPVSYKYGLSLQEAASEEVSVVESETAAATLEQPQLEDRTRPPTSRSACGSQPATGTNSIACRPCHSNPALI